MSDYIPKKEYHAIIWGKDPKQPGKRVTVLSVNLEDARNILEKEYGKGSVYYLHNEEESSRLR